MTESASSSQRKVRVSSGGSFVDFVPSQQAAFGGQGTLGGVRAVDAVTVLAWSHGQLVFKNRPLAEVLTAVNRYYLGAIVLTDEKAGTNRINATANLDRIDEWIATMGRSQNVSARDIPGFIIVG